MVATTRVLAEVQVGDLDQFLEVLSGEGRENCAEHGCLRTQVFRPAGEKGRVLVLLEWPDVAASERFREDLPTSPIMRKGGAQGPRRPPSWSR